MALIAQTKFAIQRLVAPYQIRLSTPALVIPCTAQGEPIGSLPSFTAELWQGTIKISNSLLTWDVSSNGCSVWEESGTILLDRMTADRASILIRVEHNGVASQTTLSVTKSKAGTDALPPALVRLECSAQSVARSALGIATPATVKAWRTLQVGNELEVLDKSNLIASTTSIPAGYWLENGWSNRPPVYNTTELSLIFGANNGWHTTYCNLDKSYPKILVSFEYKNKLNCNGLICAIVKNKEYYTAADPLFYPSDQWQTFSRVLEWNSSQFGLFVRGIDQSGLIFDIYVRNLKVVPFDTISYKGRNLAICEPTVTHTQIENQVNFCAQLGELYPQVASSKRYRLSFEWEYYRMAQSKSGGTTFCFQSSVLSIVNHSEVVLPKPTATPNSSPVSGKVYALVYFNPNYYWNISEVIRLDKRAELAIRMDNCSFASGGYFKVTNLLLEEVIDGTTSDVWSIAPEATLIKRNGVPYTPHTNFTLLNNTTSVRFDLFRQSTLIDTRLIPVISDGQNGNWVKQVFFPSASQPSIPAGNSLTPSGWFDEVIPCGYMDNWWVENEGGWTETDTGEYQSPPIGQNGLTKMRIRLYAEEEHLLFAIRMRSSSESNYDFGLVGIPNNGSLTRTANYTDRVSGNPAEKSIPVYLPSSGEYFLDIGYGKDGSVNVGQDRCWWQFDAKKEVTWWMSQATVSGNTQTVVSSWSTPVKWNAKDGEKGDKGDKGDKGEPGINGTPGLTGPAIVFRGDHDSGTTYYNNTLRRDVVRYSNAYYLFKGTNGSSGVWNSSHWEAFGATFESVATKLLLAESAYIADWIINNGKITSQAKTQNGTTPRAQLDGYNGEMFFNADKEVYTSGGGSKIVREQIAIRSSTGEVSVQTNEYDTAYISSQGIFANKAGIQALPSYTGIELKAAVVALGHGDLQKTAYSNVGAICGVYGSASNSNSNPAPVWGGYFNKLLANGLHLNCKRVSTNYYCTKTDNVIVCYNSAPMSVFLPSDPDVGHIIMVKVANNYSVWIRGNGKTVLRRGVGGDVDHPTNSNCQGVMACVVWDGQYWLYSYMWP